MKNVIGGVLLNSKCKAEDKLLASHSWKVCINYENTYISLWAQSARELDLDNIPL